MGVSKSQIFKFKQFDVDQAGCAMKINTDGVLLGALADADNPKAVLDIGTGTGVIALMLAQRFPGARVDAVEIDEQAAQTAVRNFANSPFTDRLTMYPVGFEAFFNVHPDEKYDLIVSNPPFYINSLRSPQKGKEIAKHADSSLFEKMVGAVSEHLRPGGLFCLILPIDTAELVTGLIENNALFVSKTIAIRSFVNYEPHRVILFVASKRMDETADDLIIYQAVNEYSPEYIKLLQPYFITF